MQCPKCTGENVAVLYKETGSRSAVHGTGFGGNFNNAARTVAAISTLGLTNLFWKNSKGTVKTKTRNKKMAVCQSCGHDWIL